MEIVDSTEKCSILIKNTDKVINQVEIENWDHCDIKTKA